MKTKSKNIFRKVIITLVLAALLLPNLIATTAHADQPPHNCDWSNQVCFDEMHHFHLHVYDPGDNDITNGTTDGNFNWPDNRNGEVGLFLFKDNANEIDKCLAYIYISDKGKWFNPGRGLTYLGRDTNGKSLRDTLKEICGPGGRINNKLNGHIDTFENAAKAAWNSDDGKTMTLNGSGSSDNYILPPQPPGTYIIRAFGTEGDMPYFPDKKAVFWKTQVTIVANDPDPQHISISGPDQQGGGTTSSVYIDPSRQEDQDKLKCHGDHVGHEMNDDTGNIKNEPGGHLFVNVVSDPSDPSWNPWQYLNPITMAMRIVVSVVGGLLDLVLGIVSSFITEIMKDWGGFMIKAPADLYSIGPVLYGWQLTRNICNIFFIIAFFVLLLLNLIGTYIDPYLIKKTLPRFIIAIIGVNLSLFICNEIVIVANSISSYFLDVGASGSSWGSVVIAGKDAWHYFAAAWSPSAGVGSLFLGLLAKILEIIYLIGLALVGLFSILVFSIRIGAIMLLAIISPFMFLALVLPISQNYAQSWWEKFIKWVFMGPVIALILYLIYTINNTAGMWNKIFPR